MVPENYDATSNFDTIFSLCVDKSAGRLPMWPHFVMTINFTGSDRLTYTYVDVHKLIYKYANKWIREKISDEQNGLSDLAQLIEFRSFATFCLLIHKYVDHGASIGEKNRDELFENVAVIIQRFREV